jgi:hypothetical protein
MIKSAFIRYFNYVEFSSALFFLHFVITVRIVMITIFSDFADVDRKNYVFHANQC